MFKWVHKKVSHDKLIITLIRVESTQNIQLNSQSRLCDWNNLIKKNYIVILKKNHVNFLNS